MHLHLYKFFFIILIILSNGFIHKIHAQEKIELQKKNQILKKEIKKINLEIDKNKKESSNIFYQINIILKKIKIQNELIKIALKERKKIENVIDQEKCKVEELKKELTSLKNTYKDVLIKAYKAIPNENSLLFLSPDNISEVSEMLNHLKMYINFQKLKATKIQKNRIFLVQNLKKMQEETEQRNEVIQNQKKEKYILESKNLKKNKLAEDLQKNRKNLISVEIKKQKQAREFDKKIQELIAREIRLANIIKQRKKKYEEIKRNQKVKKTLGKKNSSKLLPGISSKDITNLAENFTDNKGRLPWPVEQGVVISYFGRQAYPNLEGIFIDNSGIDIRTSKNAQVRAIFKGIVNEVYSTKVGVQALLIQHSNNYYTVYNNLERIYVQKGSKVKMNQPIGKVYTNLHGEALLNFQVWHNTSKQNPLHWIKCL